MAGSSSEHLDPSPKQLSILLTIARSMGQMHHIDELIDLLARESVRALGADRCAIFLLDTAAGEIWSKVALGEKKRIRFAASQGIAGQTIASGQSFRIHDAYLHPLFNKHIDEKTGYHTKNILCVPMSNAEGQIIGCFQMVNKLKGKNFTDSDQAFLQLLANQAGVAVESALLYEEKERMIGDLEVTKRSLELKMQQLEIIHEVEKILANSHTFSEFYQHVGTVISKFFGAQATFIIFQEGNHLAQKYLVTEGIISKDIGRSLQGIEHKDLILSGYKTEILAAETGYTIHKHIEESFHLNDEVDEQGAEVWGRVVLINPTNSIGDTELSFFSLIVDKIASSMGRYRMMESRAQAQRLAIIGQLSSTIIHDFRNPMTTIRGFAEILKQADQRKAEMQRQKLCSTIISQVDRCGKMIEELLSFARGDKSYHFAQHDAEAFLQEIGELLEVETAQTGVKLEKEILFHGDIYIDKDKMMRVIFNLTNNALEILKEGQSLILGIREVEGDFIQLNVRDTGPGIPVSIQESLFEAFVTEGKASGTGLGLHISKEIVSGHHGKIELDRSYTQGASFLIKIPKKIPKVEESVS